MKTYTVVFGEDVPHYGVAEIAAQDAAAVIEAAKAYDRDNLSAYDAEWSCSVCARICNITDDETGEIVGEDIALDGYFLRDGGEEARRLCDAAADMRTALEDALLASGYGILAPIPHADRFRVPAWVWKARAAIMKATGRDGAS